MFQKFVAKGNTKQKLKGHHLTPNSLSTCHSTNTTCSLFDTSVVSSTISEKKLLSNTDVDTLRKIFRAMIWRSSFCICGAVNLSCFFSIQERILESLSLWCFRSSRKFDSESLWPRRASPWRDIYRMLLIVWRSLARLSIFSFWWTWFSTASQWLSDFSCKRNFLVASFQFMSPVVVEVGLAFILPIWPLFLAPMQT